MRTAKKICKYLVLSISFFLFQREALAQYRDYYGRGMGPGMMGWGGGVGWLGPIFMVLFWGLIVVLIVLLIRWLLSSTHAKTSSVPQEDSALEILKKRYARGEINKEEFEAKKKDLS
jgi:putative membrane protein